MQMHLVESPCQLSAVP
jgi:hypothetical protein